MRLTHDSIGCASGCGHAISARRRASWPQLPKLTTKRAALARESVTGSAVAEIGTIMPRAMEHIRVEIRDALKGNAEAAVRVRAYRTIGWSPWPSCRSKTLG